MTDDVSSGRHAFLELDAMRGVAAVCVMVYHFSPFLAATTVLPSAYLAVDLFFILSGFVIAHAYHTRLVSGMSFARFAVLRLIRLYPLYIAGTLLGLLYLLLRNVLMPAEAVMTAQVFGPMTLSALFMPQLWPNSTLRGLYPFDPAAWSLLFEVLVNLGYALGCATLTPRRLRWLMAAGAIGVVICVGIYGSLDLGMTRRTLFGGLARVTFSFFARVYLRYEYQRRVGGHSRAVTAPAGPRFAFEALMVVLFGVFCANFASQQRQIYDTLCVLLLFPILIWLGARLPSPRVLRSVYAEAGRLSYAIYILHTPLLLIAAGVYKALRHADPMLARPYSGVGFVVFTLVAAALMVRFYDEPVRRRLGGLLAAWRPIAPLARPSGMPTD